MTEKIVTPDAGSFDWRACVPATTLWYGEFTNLRIHPLPRPQSQQRVAPTHLDDPVVVIDFRDFLPQQPIPEPTQLVSI